MLTKVDVIIRYIEELIENGELSYRERVPSLTEMMKRFAVSRDTVVRAYKKLNNRGILNAVHGKGYFVANKTIVFEINLFLFLDELSSYKNTLVKSIELHLTKKGKYNIFFHHYNADMFERLIQENLGQYTHYAISPFPKTKEVQKSIEQIPENKLILLDRHDDQDKKWRFVGQEFFQDITNCLNQLQERIKKYKRFIFIFPEPSYHPKELKTGFEKYCKGQHIKYSIVSNITSATIKPNDAYLVIDDNDLASVVKTVRKENWILGQDIGLISYNETPLKSVVSDGITTISTNFELMGELLVKMILNPKIKNIHNESQLILRNSF
ncbi:GntR family transcriptional regulator [Aestuariivivens sp. NBU2969]|uniref:GntR family transcriptional regulator n=1 Tax=Aestuariivivens sp. NBU2969 TaxID=2873267 RepID=UPI001CBEDC04|nr:GntR family transcriptional regulator [Aestuariivivens sp. NBU2969]